MLQIGDTKQMLDALLGAATGLQMVSIVSHNSDKDLDALETYATELLSTADDSLTATLRQRLRLLRSIRDQQDEVIYTGFVNSTTTGQLETFAFDMDEISLLRLERIVKNRALAESTEMADTLRNKLDKVVKLRRELKPVKDGIFRFLAADTDEQAEAILRERADVLLTELAGHELLQSSSRDRAIKGRLIARRKVWRRVYGEVSGKSITGLMRSLDENDTAEIKVEPLQRKKVETEVEAASAAKEAETPPSSTDSISSMTQRLTGKVAPSEPLPTQVPPTNEAVEEADRLMSEVYDLLDEAIGNAMVAFDIYRKNKSTRADEALKILTELYNETKESD